MDATTTESFQEQGFTVGRSYDTKGRLDALTYPEGFAVKHLYNSVGYLQALDNATDGQRIWTANDMDPHGEVTLETAGNGLVTLRNFDPAKGFLKQIRTGPSAASTAVQYLMYDFDASGNVTGRHDLNRHLAEAFEYDVLNRLTRSQISGSSNPAAAVPKIFAYDDIGNLVSKTDVGTYTYGNGPAGPHAVTNTSGVNGSASYAYDANGNMLQGGDRTISYMSFNQPYEIAKGELTSTFRYDDDHGRVHKRDVEGNQTEETYYIGKIYERVFEGSSRASLPVQQ